MLTTEKKIIAELTCGLAQTISRVARRTGSTPKTVKKVRDKALAEGIIRVWRFDGCQVAYKLNDTVTVELTDSKAVVTSASDEVFFLEVNIQQNKIVDYAPQEFPQKVRLLISRELLNQLKEVPTGDFDYDNAPKNVPFF